MFILAVCDFTIGILLFIFFCIASASFLFQNSPFLCHAFSLSVINSNNQYGFGTNFFSDQQRLGDYLVTALLTKDEKANKGITEDQALFGRVCVISSTHYPGGSFSRWDDYFRGE